MVFKMKIYAPKYYKRFKCIADKCKNSCCVGWEIDIDDKVYEKYLSVGGKLTDNIVTEEDCRYFRLDNGRCPHLKENGLCEIIIERGEEYLAQICREHPRFYNYVCGRKEAGIGIVCEEAARLVINDKDTFLLEEIGECDEEDISAEYSSLTERDSIIRFAFESDKHVFEKLQELKERYSVSTEMHTVYEWIDMLLELEILDEAWRNILKERRSRGKKNDICDYNDEILRLFIYFVYRHVTAATSYSSLRARLGFSILSIEIISYLFEREEACDVNALTELARLFSSEIEYSEENTDALIFEIESALED